jgi:hypothetical protein
VPGHLTTLTERDLPCHEGVGYCSSAACLLGETSTQHTTAYGPSWTACLLLRIGCASKQARARVKGHRDFPVGGQVISLRRALRVGVDQEHAAEAVQPGREVNRSRGLADPALEAGDGQSHGWPARRSMMATSSSRR